MQSFGIPVFDIPARDARIGTSRAGFSSITAYFSNSPFGGGSGFLLYLATYISSNFL
jgi:hypothetical protein